ncbi:basement membrane-specific heparan sulfate proteoglycan core protein-like [Gadus chalcogrammus]|uniref:basement membrane-specific heparan sulfate proteoglycan core protein-like n=1 Tax=Gadus chalcogrammus TaxID=1042646 RepID=UPI0024C3CCFA|nr:basement membrane-specific heparan sulfate proteoglycan core protein-like [Gadus chalcogrammus]
MDTSTAAAILISLVLSVGAQAPVVSIEPRVVSVRQGESVSIRCIVDGSQHPITREWKKSNSPRLADNVKVSRDGYVLTIADAQPDNQGQYRCVAANPAGRTSGTAVLNVRYPPTVTLTPAGPLRVRVGEPVSIECRVTGRPRPSLKWKRLGSPLDLVTKATEDVNTLEWALVRPEDSGVYACQAQNNEGMTEVKVEVTVQNQGTPVASVAVELITAVQGHTVTMECHATGNPTPVVTWSKLRAPLPWRHTVSGGVLTLTEVGRQDSGQYICNATNVHGYSLAYTQMEVEAPPYTTILPEQVRLRAGDALRLQCLAHGAAPLSFQWSRAGRAGLAPGAETTGDGQLLIARVKLSDSGTYKCVATNHLGASEALGKVVVKN